MRQQRTLGPRRKGDSSDQDLFESWRPEAEVADGAARCFCSPLAGVVPAFLWRRMPSGPHLVVAVAAVFAGAIGGSSAWGEPRPQAAQSDEPLPTELLGRWFRLDPPGLVVTSEPHIYMFCAAGNWFAQGSKGTRSGRYTFREGELCREMSGWRDCARLEKSLDGYSLEAEGQPPGAGMRFVPAPGAGMGPPECLHSLPREERVAPSRLPGR